MKWLTLELIKQNSRIRGNNEDTILELYANSAEEQVLSTLKRLAEQGTAIVYVGHQLEKMEQFCDSICFIKNGKAVRSK